MKDQTVRAGASLRRDRPQRGQSSGEVKTLLSIRSGSGAFPGGPRTGKVSEGCQVKNQNIGPEDCISEYCNPSVLT